MVRPDIRRPERIANDTSLAVGALELDSLDRLELAIAIEERFGVALCGELSSAVFMSIATLEQRIRSHTQGPETPQAAPEFWPEAVPLSWMRALAFGHRALV